MRPPVEQWDARLENRAENGPPRLRGGTGKARRDGGTRLFNRLIHNLGSRAGKGWLDTKKVVSISIIIVTT